MNILKKTLLSLMLVAASVLVDTSTACTRVLHAESGLPVMVGRSMDWFRDLGTNLFIYPQGLQRDGQVPINPLRWTAKYGSIAATAYDRITTDGMNEKGLAAHLLNLNETDFGQRDNNKPGLGVYQWAQFYLDNFESVDEAVRYTTTQSFQIVDVNGSPLHLAIEDANGDSAIIEYLGGKPVVYHDNNYKVMTNSPTYDKQLQNMQLYIGLGGDQVLPGTLSAADRFVRAAYYEKYLPEAKTANEEVMNIFSVLNAVAEPYGSNSPGRMAYIPTLWEVVSDLSNKVYYYHSTQSLSTVYTSLTRFDLKPGARTMKLDLVNHPDLAGDVTKKFVAVE